MNMKTNNNYSFHLRKNNLHTVIDKLPAIQKLIILYNQCIIIREYK